MHPQNSREISSIPSYIDSLLSDPNQSPNTIRRSASQRTISDSLIAVPDALPQKYPPISPIKKRSRSEDKASQLFGSSVNYAQQHEGESEMITSLMSELEEAPQLPPKSVQFRETLIMRNAHNRRENSPQKPKTPSILKKSQLLRDNCAKFLHQNTQSTEKYVSAVNDDRQERAQRSNQLVRRRYLAIIERFQAKKTHKFKNGFELSSEDKYQDDLFPPIPSSFRAASKINQKNPIEAILWARIPDIFTNILTVLPAERSRQWVKCHHQCSNFIGEAFTALRNCKPILDKMFQSAILSEFGVYMVKIFQQNVWKYVIIDDFIPVRTSAEGKLQPYFLTSLTKQDEPFQIWPFLLEKAYANYYGNYEFLHSGNSLDFLEEITGLTAEVFQYMPNQKRLAESNRRLQRLLSLQDTTLVGFIQQEQAFVPLELDKADHLKALLGNQQTTTTVPLDQLFEYFDRIYTICPQNYTHYAVSTIGINARRQNLARFDISLRILKLDKPAMVSISVRQKELRFYQRSSLSYSYIWVRVILLQKEFDGDCRWIEGKYSAKKSINFNRHLEEGEYFIIVLPEWKAHAYELSLIVSASQPVALRRREYDDSEGLMEKGCCDLAQRLGKLSQINLYACSYTLVSEEVGLLIQNVNNERYQGDIRVTRNIAALKPTVGLLPFNKQFYLNKGVKTPFSTRLSVYVPADKSFTVILMTRGGIDHPFLRKFDFGK